MDGLYFDFAAFRTQEYNYDLELATELPATGDELKNYSYKHTVTKMEDSRIFAQLKETEELHISKAIVREIIQTHGERIDVISTEGVGTEFVFSLKTPKSTSSS